MRRRRRSRRSSTSGTSLYSIRRATKSRAVSRQSCPSRLQRAVVAVAQLERLRRRSSTSSPSPSRLARSFARSSAAFSPHKAPHSSRSTRHASRPPRSLAVADRRLLPTTRRLESFKHGPLDPVLPRAPPSQQLQGPTAVAHPQRNLGRDEREPAAGRLWRRRRAESDRYQGRSARVGLRLRVAPLDLQGVPQRAHRALDRVYGVGGCHGRVRAGQGRGRSRRGLARRERAPLHGRQLGPSPERHAVPLVRGPAHDGLRLVRGRHCRTTRRVRDAPQGEDDQDPRDRGREHAPGQEEDSQPRPVPGGARQADRAGRRGRSLQEELLLGGVDGRDGDVEHDRWQGLAARPLDARPRRPPRLKGDDRPRHRVDAQRAPGPVRLVPPRPRRGEGRPHDPPADEPRHRPVERGDEQEQQRRRGARRQGRSAARRWARRNELCDAEAARQRARVGLGRARPQPARRRQRRRAALAALAACASCADAGRHRLALVAKQHSALAASVARPGTSRRACDLVRLVLSCARRRRLFCPSHFLVDCDRQPVRRSLPPHRRVGALPHLVLVDRPRLLFHLVRRRRRRQGRQAAADVAAQGRTATALARERGQRRAGGPDGGRLGRARVRPVLVAGHERRERVRQRRGGPERLARVNPLPFVAPTLPLSRLAPLRLLLRSHPSLLPLDVVVRAWSRRS